MENLVSDTIDRNVEDWGRIADAIAFRTPDEDEILIRRKVMCPDSGCGHVLVMVLATGVVVNYAKRHQDCKLIDGETGEERDNG
jgi:hypothetical protein